ncbi:flavodoxin [Halarcobacter mediterraneus]|uniref:Flavodoxin n=1 Tax=Halarcobacter mediterraneus TaxID=2023153 RepID=A0A4Q1ATD7_9BACT|nr:flavodoxin [Halarcobacter mediterraneus]RXK11718.1 flavodoxin [Halarcobacter mediterraneus]
MKAIFYATSTGNTEEVANKINDNLEGFDLVDIASDGVDKMNDCEVIIMGISTWGEGELQDDWEDCFDDIKEMDFSGKKVALFGLGDQESYGHEFVDALGIMYETLIENKAEIIGKTSTDGYEYEYSRAEVDGEFAGLVIDEDNQSDLTDERVENWCNKITALF